MSGGVHHNDAATPSASSARGMPPPSLLTSPSLGPKRTSSHSDHTYLLPTTFSVHTHDETIPLRVYIKINNHCAHAHVDHFVNGTMHLRLISVPLQYVPFAPSELQLLRSPAAIVALHALAPQRVLAMHGAW